MDAVVSAFKRPSLRIALRPLLGKPTYERRMRLERVDLLSLEFAKSVRRIPPEIKARRRCVGDVYAINVVTLLIGGWPMTIQRKSTTIIEVEGETVVGRFDHGSS